MTGGAGTVASAMLRCVPTNVDAHLTWRATAPPPGGIAHRVELSDAAVVARLFDEVEPEVVVHTAYSMRSRVDVVDATREIATACARSGAALVHLSTEAVFDGDHAPYDESDRPAPVSEYGRWKLEAEVQAASAVADVCLTRSSLVVSLDPPDPATRQVLVAAEGSTELTLFADELRQPILADDLAQELWALVAMDRAARAGTWHLPGAEVMSRFELGRRVCALAGVDSGRILAGSQADHPVRRPRDLTMTSTRRQRLGCPPRAIAAAGRMPSPLPPR